MELGDLCPERFGRKHFHIRPMLQDVHHQFLILTVGDFEQIVALGIERGLLLRVLGFARDPAGAFGGEAKFCDLVGLAGEDAVA